jgi:hypothetical protein
LLLKSLILVLVVALVAFVAVTWWALEANGVAIVQTMRRDGTVRVTHVWYVQSDSETLLEAGTPENGWFVDAGRDPNIAIVEPAALAGRYTVEVLPNPDGHDRIRSSMRDKYGWRDRWIGTVFDTSRSIAVRLLPADADR